VIVCIFIAAAAAIVCCWLIEKPLTAMLQRMTRNLVRPRKETVAPRAGTARANV
jgi:peptidoglycan/LPS O-acetylase OafA/YrhL